MRKRPHRKANANAAAKSTVHTSYYRASALAVFVYNSFKHSWLAYINLLFKSLFKNPFVGIHAMGSTLQLLFVPKNAFFMDHLLHNALVLQPNARRPEL